jgi:hypothetical protein
MQTIDRVIAVDAGGCVIPLFRNILLSMSAGLLGLSAICQVPLNGPAPRTKQYSGLNAQRAQARGWKVVEGDIIQDKAAPAQTAVRPRPNTLTVASQTSLWPKVDGVATVYYVNANAGAMDQTDETANANIQTAIDTFNADFPNLIQWVQWTSSDGPNYVEIDLNAGDYSGECEAAEGYEAIPEQPMTGSAQCAVGTILHEMGHIIGLWHEFIRPDAADYVTVNYNNVIKGSWGNFETQTQNAQILGLYDYASVMQYPPYSFSRNGGPVIETIPAGMPLGSAEGVPVPAHADYSAGDKETIERLYGASPTKVTVTSNPVGLQVVVDGAIVTTPQTYSWALNSTHTLDVASGGQTLTGDIEGSTTSATFYYTYGRWNDNGAQSHTITVLPGDGGVGFPSTEPQVATYSANFIQLVPYTTAVYPTSTGGVGISPTPQTYSGISGEFFIARQQATLTATPNPGWSFYEFNNGPFWLPGGLGANPKTFYVPDSGDPVDTTVEFTNAPVYLVDITPETFSSNLSVIVDGDYVDTPHNFSPYYDTTWTSGSTHTLNYNGGFPEYPFSVNSRYAFSSWSDGGAASHTTSSLPATNTSYIATVIPQFAPATNFGYPPCGGTGALTPASPTDDGFYPTGQVLTYTATPTTTPQLWTFAGWTFDLTGTTTPANLTATDETLVFANFNIVAAPLTLTSLSPSSADTGGSAFTLTLMGTGFSPASNVSVNGSYRTVTYVNAETLQVPITTADLATAGTFQVFVENFPSGWDGCAVFGYQTFNVHNTNLATTTAVSSSGTPSTYGTSVTFTATVTSSESNATGNVMFMDSSTSLGSAALNGSGVATYSTASLAVATHSITAVYGGDSNNSASTSPVLKQSVTGTAAVLASPTPSSTLAGGPVTFTWTPGNGATGYALWIGSTGAGSDNLYYSGQKGSTVTSLTVSGLPVNGETIYARMITYYGSSSAFNSYTYTSATGGILTTPAPSSTLAGPSVTFSWTAGSGATGYALWIGSTGPGSDNLYYSGEHASTVTSLTPPGLPTNGETLYVRLITYYGSNSGFINYTYTAATAATLTTPAPGSTLAGPSVTFSWTAAANATGYALWAGTTGMGSGEDNLYYSGEKASTVTSLAVSGLPVNGETIYMRLITYYGSASTFTTYTYTSATGGILTTPAPSSTLAGPSVTFSWTAGSGATGYALWIGSTGPGSDNLYYSGEHASTVTSLTPPGLPTNGETLYVRLITYYGSNSGFINYTYTAATQATMTTPAPSSRLAGSSVTFSWAAAANATGYALWIGSTGPGSDNLYYSGEKATTVNSLTVNGLPTNGETLYVRLITYYGSSSSFINYTYTAATP